MSEINRQTENAATYGLTKHCWNLILYPETHDMYWLLLFCSRARALDMMRFPSGELASISPVSTSMAACWEAETEPMTATVARKKDEVFICFFE